LVTPSILLADTENSVNERLPFTPLELEAHWGVNCTSTLAALEQLINAPAQIFESNYLELKPVIDDSLSSLKKCAIIYNTPNTNRFSPCTDYLSIHSQLNDLKSTLFLTKERFYPNQIQSILGPLRNTLTSIRCNSNQN